MSNEICKIDISDVAKAGSVPHAILAWAKESDTVASGVVGSSFSTSGPGVGWSHDHTTAEYAICALDGGALAYVDCDDGRVIESISPDEADEGSDVLTDMQGCEYVVGEWSSSSRVRLECPDEEDAIANPVAFAQMLDCVLGVHGPCSAVDEWKNLARAIMECSDCIRDVVGYMD